MLLQFSAENHLSLSTRQTLSLVASSLKDDPSGLIKSSAVPGLSLLPAIVIYGANASGKSNVLAALRFAIDMVRTSHSSGGPNDSLNRQPFALDDEIKSSPSTYELEFVVDNVRYNYGFEIDDKEVLAEWLVGFPNSRRQKLFDRKRMQFEFGRGLKGRNKVISELTRPNSLFLSAAAQNSHELLSKISVFIRSIYGDQRISVSAHDLGRPSAELGFESDRAIKFLEEIGTGASSIRRREEAYSDQQMEFQKELFSLIKKSLDIDMEKMLADQITNKITSVELGHKTSAGEMVYFSLDRESAGTRRLLALLHPMFRALDSGTVFVVDELNASLHTKAAEMILAMFCNAATNPNGAQLIATTHDTHLLRSQFLRRDQIWFADKDASGGSHIYPLTDIRTRKTDNIEIGYLEGRYGAVPFTGDYIAERLDK